VLGSPRRAEYRTPLCMPPATVGDRCARVESARSAFWSDSLQPRKLGLLAKNRPISHGRLALIGGDIIKRKRGLADAPLAVHPLLRAFDRGSSRQAQCGGADGDSELLRLSTATCLVLRSRPALP
jgi:hypothetical protein